MTDMQRSWLIQRLQKPIGSPENTMTSVSEAFAFGGGLRNGGLTKDAMDLLRPLFRFDYMGAAEFEWGAVPEAFGKMVESAPDLLAAEFTIPYADVPPHWRDEDPVTPEGEATIYMITPIDWAGEVMKRIKGWASEDYNSDLKENTRLAATLRPDPKMGHDLWDVCGWLELDNGFMFFTDEDMFNGMCGLLDIPLLLEEVE